jgi:hypothetical protein
MDAALALVAAFLFAVAATLQQKGALHLPKISLTHPSSLWQLIGQTMWLLGTIALIGDSVGTMLSNWQPYVLAVAGISGFVLQQVSLGTGRLAPSVATVSTVNPVVGILIGTILLDESWSRPLWHIAIAAIGLVVALIGAVVISLATEAGSSTTATEPETAQPLATT